MRIAFISPHNPNNRIVRSGVPYGIYHQLSKTNEVFWIKPEIKGVIRRFLYWGLKCCIKAERLFGYKSNERLISMDRLYAHDIEHKLKRSKADAVFALSTQYLGTLRSGLPIFIRIDAIFHSFYGYYFDGFSKRSLRNAKRTEEKELSKVTAVFAASQWVLDEAKKQIPHLADKFILVETGANLEKENIVIREKTYHPRRPLNVLFVGFDVKRKGIDIALQSIKILNEIYKIKAKLIVIGGKPEEKLQDSPYLDYKGLLDKNDHEQCKRMYHEFSEADLFLFPTKAECHGIVNCEAAAYALPIFSYDTGGVSSYVKNGINGYALPLTADAKDFAESIFRSIQNGDMQKFSRNSRKLFEERFNWDSWGEKVNRIMGSIIESIHNESK